ncbi:MAG TPA: hypothetical protein O0X70_05765 [Methanocorpusculum sp.]|nr:hypothetical protein [Methanocorpusculum sp.]
MTDENILAEIRKYRKLSSSTYAKDACRAKRRADGLMKEHGVAEEDLQPC